MILKTYEEYLAACIQNNIGKRFEKSEWEELKKEFTENEKLLKKIEELDHIKYKIFRLAHSK